MRLKALAVVLVCVTGLILGKNPRSFAQEVDATEAIQHYRESLPSNNDSVSFRSERVEQRLSTSGTTTKVDHWKIDFANRRMWVKSEDQVSSSGETAADTGRAPGGYAERILSSSRMEQISAGKDGKAERFTSRLQVPEDYWSSSSFFFYLSIPLGYIRVGKDYSEIPSLLDQQTTAKRVGDEVVLERLGADYQLTLNLDPSKGWSASQFKLTVNEKEGQRVVTYTVDRFDRSGDQWYPGSFHTETTTPAKQSELAPSIRIKNGVVVRDLTAKKPQVVSVPAGHAKAQVEITDFSTRHLSDDAFEFVSTIPERMPVGVQDALHMDYVWWQGRVVPEAEALMPLPEGISFAKQGTRWLFYGGLLLFAVALYAMRRQTATKSSPK